MWTRIVFSDWILIVSCFYEVPGYCVAWQHCQHRYSIIRQFTRRQSSVTHELIRLRDWHTIDWRCWPYLIHSVLYALAILIKQTSSFEHCVRQCFPHTACSFWWISGITPSLRRNVITPCSTELEKHIYTPSCFLMEWVAVATKQLLFHQNIQPTPC